MCPLDCPDACSLEVKVEEGRVASVEGSNVNPLTDGFICAKVRRFADHMYGPDRVLQPAVRDGDKGSGAFRPASWDEALDRVAAAMAAASATFGGESILPFCYGGSNGYLTQDAADARLFRRLGASRLLRTVCAAPTGAAADGVYGKMPGVALTDYEHARLIVVWGCNPTVSGIHLGPPIARARRAGGATGGRRPATHAAGARGRPAHPGAPGDRPARGAGDHQLAVRQRARRQGLPGRARDRRRCAALARPPLDAGAGRRRRPTSRSRISRRSRSCTRRPALR